MMSGFFLIFLRFFSPVDTVETSVSLVPFVVRTQGHLYKSKCYTTECFFQLPWSLPFLLNSNINIHLSGWLQLHRLYSSSVFVYKGHLGQKVQDGRKGSERKSKHTSIRISWPPVLISGGVAP